MFHMPSGGSFGKCADNEERNRHVQEYFRWFMGTVAKGILSDEEFDKVVTRRNDIFLDAETVQQRLDVLNKPVAQPAAPVQTPQQTQEPQPETPTPEQQPVQTEEPIQPAVEGNHE
jgi:hypothetical protein